ncbi:enolase C-terminal domain-like protein [Rhodococcus sp. H29-C3]|uniref:enolase C-terminal domain-like protein n=1 Tax=Rhodococcus sp. H29-C3 TaxID=3046307 RepID=UPI0024B8F694|nr:enolase C-terminal domain-like protein [Rhodococcus sp. H29-C3]MDJ0362271.1 enolase C-terminal domain-like protein [Rhodococcus sp. H29-C3]
MPTTAPEMTMSTELVTVPLITTYQYSRASDDSCTLVRVTFRDGQHYGRGEGSPFESFFQTDTTDAREALDSAATLLETGESPADIIDRSRNMPVKNAIEAAWVDFTAKRTNTTAAEQLDVQVPDQQVVMTTISMGDQRTIEAELERTAAHPLLKLKLGSGNDTERIRITRRHRPDARLVVDVNGDWDAAALDRMLPVLLDADVEMIEQPLPPTTDSSLARFDSPIPIFADESFSTATDLDRLVGLYDGVNVKLDKCGGVTSALACIESARARGLRIMVGCLPASSLSTAVGMHAVADAEWVDLDNHLWLRYDVDPSIGYSNGLVYAPDSELWG